MKNVYCSDTEIIFQKDEFVIDFSMVIFGSREPLAEIILSPGNTKVLLYQLRQTIRDYEEQFERIPKPKEVEKEKDE